MPKTVQAREENLVVHSVKSCRTWARLGTVYARAQRYGQSTLQSPTTTQWAETELLTKQSSAKTTSQLKLKRTFQTLFYLMDSALLWNNIWNQTLLPTTISTSAARASPFFFRHKKSFRHVTRSSLKHPTRQR